MRILEQWRRDETPVVVFHTNGYRSFGKIVDFDASFLHLNELGVDKLIRWTAVSTIQLNLGAEADGHRPTVSDSRDQGR